MAAGPAGADQEGIEQHRTQRVPRTALIPLANLYVRKYEEGYLTQQISPTLTPLERELRNQVGRILRKAVG